MKAAVDGKPYGLLDGRIALSNTPLNGGGVEAQIALVGNNLTNKKYFFSGTDFGQFGTVNWGLRRTVSVEASIEF
ncbi:hypothetical protein [Rhizorhapis sp. SPR117]|uniref:hypothetical protein n=1 Tax=Rhizorhapis sp. SPR117 TaxID=2912611 RepID=UPI001F27E4FF|nr:hypothetical protein [Rhizorhapis sp. SPR117]